MRNWINTLKSLPITPVCQTPNSSSVRAWQHVPEPKKLRTWKDIRLVIDDQINYLISPSYQAFYCQ